MGGEGQVMGMSSVTAGPAASETTRVRVWEDKQSRQPNEDEELAGAEMKNVFFF